MKLLDIGKTISKQKLAEIMESMSEKNILYFDASHGRSLLIRREGEIYYLTFNKLFTHRRNLAEVIEEAWDWIQKFYPSSYELWEET